MNTLPKRPPSVTLADIGVEERTTSEPATAREIVGAKALAIPPDLVMGDRYLAEDVRALLAGPMRRFMSPDDIARAELLAGTGGLLSPNNRAWLRQFNAWYDPSNMDAVQRSQGAADVQALTKKKAVDVVRRTAQKIAASVPYPRPPSQPGSASIADPVAPPAAATSILGPVMLIGGLTAVAGLVFYVVRNVK